MKTRTGFVSNSSSASFVLVKSAMTKKQIRIMMDWFRYVNKDYWHVTEDEHTISGNCLCDNGYLEKYVRKNKINSKAFKLIRQG